MFTFIESIEDLAFLNQELLLKPYVGVDTEFRRTTKDNMRLALLQINDVEEIYLVDTVKACFCSIKSSIRNSTSEAA